jgi:GNAT superfamily N-acetyltransferase
MTIRLRNGTLVVLRPIRPEDKALLARGVERFSERTAYRRFLGPKDHLTAAELRYLIEIDLVDHYAIVAVHADDPQRLAGVGRWVRGPADREAAEMAIVVADDLQGQGLGTRLGRALAESARQHGIKRFTATMLAENVPVRRLFAHLAEHLEGERDGSVYELTADLAA